MELAEGHFWGNLGLWRAGSSYVDAARALARHVGTAAALKSGSTLLDLGSGYGAQLGLWHNDFKVTSILTVEPSSEARRAARAYTSQLELDITWTDVSNVPKKSLDSVVSVDAAYHFTQRQHLLKTLSQALKPAGQLAWTDLLLTRVATSGQHPIQRISSAFDIPPENLLSEAAYTQTLERAGFRDIQIENLSAEVLGGFAAHWREALAAHRSRPDASWLKYSLTALASKLAIRSDTPRYVLVRASKA